MASNTSPRTPVRRRVLLVIIAIPVLLSLTAFQVFGYRLSGGVSGRYYWLDGSVGSYMESEIYSSKWLWGNATSAVSWTETSTKSSSVMDFYHSGMILPYCGATYFYSGSTQVNPRTQNWQWNKIVLTSDLGSTECSNYRGIIVHEIGHVMGLDHSGDGATAVMREDIAGLTYQAPKADDVNGIEWLY